MLECSLQDEISTGLDSSTTYQIVKFLREMTRLQDHTTLVALLQPAPETFELFDDVMLISEGALHLLTSVCHMQSVFGVVQPPAWT